MIYKENYNPEMPYTERVAALRDHPVLAARAFKSRLENTVKYIWQGKTKPIGDVIDFWIRLEFQNRGSLHAHIILWALLYYLNSKLNGEQLTRLLTGDVSFIDEPNAKFSASFKKIIEEIKSCNVFPTVNSDETEIILCQECNKPNKTREKDVLRKCRRLVSKVVSQYAKADVPPDNENPEAPNVPIPVDSMLHGSLQDFDFEEVVGLEEQILRNMILSVQQHDINHRKTCFKKGHFCRFFYPKDLRDETEIKFVKLKGLIHFFLQLSVRSLYFY